MPQPPPPNEVLLNRVRRRLKERIAETGITVARLAKRSGVSAGTIWRLIRGEGDDIYLGTLANLSRVLLIDVRELLTPYPDEDEPDQPEQR